VNVPAPLYLYEVPSVGQGRALATLTLRRMDVLPSGDGLELNLDADWLGQEPEPGPRWLYAAAEIWSRQLPTRRIGAIHIDNYDFPTLAGTGRRSVSWDWYVPPEEAEHLERDRATNAAAVLPLRLRVAGLLRLGEAVIGTAGEGSIDLTAVEWAETLRRLGYATSPSVSALVGQAAGRHGSWAEAERRLSRARQALHAGGEREALAAAFEQFERLVNRPYLAGAWDPVFSRTPALKRKELAKLLAAHTSLISRVGRHLDPEPDPDTGERNEFTLDYWEAELLVALSQLLLTLALRTRSDPAASS
jgi:hypothetical protein